MRCGHDEVNVERSTGKLSERCAFRNTLPTQTPNQIRKRAEAPYGCLQARALGSAHIPCAARRDTIESTHDRRVQALGCRASLSQHASQTIRPFSPHTPIFNDALVPQKDCSTPIPTSLPSAHSPPYSSIPVAPSPNTEPANRTRARQEQFADPFARAHTHTHNTRIGGRRARCLSATECISNALFGVSRCTCAESVIVQCFGGPFAFIEGFISCTVLWARAERPVH